MQKQLNMTNIKKFQYGAVLFVGLIMLLVLTLMGIVAMKSSILQEKLASGSMDQNVAFQSAESALRDAEIYINSSITPASGFVAACTNGLCLPSTTSTSVWDAISDWTNDARPIVFGSKTAAPTILELLPDLPSPPGGSAKETDGTAFRITAMGWGKRPSSAVMLQSVYVKI
jgi:type IV pilus assembly protein PilX